jgi:phosphoglycerate dehydrogenase-like enzyme
MKVVLFGALGRRGREVLSARFGDRIAIETCSPNDDADVLATTLGDADVFISSSFNQSIPDMEKLQLLQLPMSGYDDVDFDAVPASAAICNVYEHETGIAEYVFAAMLNDVVHLSASNDLFKTGDWRESPRLAAATRGELMGKTILCVGYGNIGQAVGRRARAFDMGLLALTRSPRELEPKTDRMGGYGELADFLPAADYVLICCPLTDDTRGMIGRAAFKKMKPDAVIINVARGPIIDQQAMYDALRDNEIRGAVIDTWYNYPDGQNRSVEPADVPIDKLDHVLITPHLSGWTDGQQRRRWERMGDNIENLLSERPLDNVLR